MPLTDEERSLLQGNMGDPQELDQLRMSLGVASERNPDQYAKVTSLAERSGLPTDVVEMDPSDIERRETLKDIDVDQLAKTHPKTAEYLKNPDNASVSFDDIPNLKGLEDADRKIGRAQTALGKLYRGAASGVSNTVRGHTAETVEAYSTSLDLMKRIDRGEDLPWYTIKNPTVRAFEEADADGREKMLADIGRKLNPEQYSSWKTAESIDRAVEEHIKVNPRYADEFLTGKVSEGLGSMFTFMAVSLATRGMGAKGYTPEIMTGQFASEQMRGAGFKEALESGASFEDAATAAQLESVMGYSEALPIARIFDRLDKGSGGQLKRTAIDTVKAGTEEAIQEFSQTLWSNLVASEIVGYDPDRGLFTGSGEGAAVGFTVGALTQFVVSMVAGRRGAGSSSTTSAERDMRDLRQTLQEQDAIDQIVSLSQSSTTNGRAQDKFNSFLKALQNKEVLIPADVVEQLENAPDVLTAQLDGTGTDVSIPIDTFSSEIASNEALMEVIRPHIKMTHEAKSLSELETDPSSLVQRLVNRAMTQEREQTESDRIYEQVKDQIVGTGRQSEQTARLSAQLYPAMIERVAQEHNITVEEAYQRLGFDLRGPSDTQTVEEPTTTLESGLSLDQDFGDLEITTEATVQETGETVTLTENAQRKFTQTVKRRNVVEQIQRCLNG